MIDIGLVLTNYFNGCDYTLVGNSYENLEWRDKETPKPTEEELNNLWGDAKQIFDAKEARATRDRLIAETDWMALSDVQMSDGWAAYRQALRNVPEQPGFPDNIDWPEKPE